MLFSEIKAAGSKKSATAGRISIYNLSDEKLRVTTEFTLGMRHRLSVIIVMPIKNHETFFAK